MANLLKVVSTRLEYWAGRYQTVGRLTEADEKNLLEGMVSDLQFISGISLENAIQLHGCLQKATFLNDQTKAMLYDMIDSRVAHTEIDETVVRIKVRTIEFYQSHKCWAIYASNDPDDYKLFWHGR